MSTDVASHPRLPPPLRMPSSSPFAPPFPPTPSPHDPPSPGTSITTATNPQSNNPPDEHSPNPGLNATTQSQSQTQANNTSSSASNSHPRLPPPLAPPTKPRMPRSESFNPTPATRPTPVRAAFSTYGMAAAQAQTPQTLASSVMFRNGSGENEGSEKDELTTKGRKRKRLAKACSACHKNKRRCDGFAPCSNCEFSSRPCLYLNAQGEPIPPPRTRDTSDTPLRAKDENNLPAVPGSSEKRDEWNSATQEQGQLDGDREEGHANEGSSRRRSSERKGWSSPLEAVERDISLSVELVDLFSTRVQPFSAMFHRPTFQHRLYLGQVSPLLLDAIYALSSRLSSHPALLSSLPLSHPHYLRGEVFAERAHVSLKRALNIRSTWSDEAKAHDKGTFEETELIQTMFLLSVYYMFTKQSSLGMYYLDLSISFLRPTTSATLAPPAPHLQVSTTEYLTLMETRHRTFWLIVLSDLCAASSTNSNGRPRRLADHEIYNIPLPGDEIHWMRYGAVGSNGRDCGRRDGLAVGTGNWIGEEGLVGELGHVLRILLIFCEIMAVANGTDGKNYPAGHHEQALKLWAISLPRHLRFDEHNLGQSIAKLSSPVPEISTAGFLYAYMHAIAECGMFYLQAAVGASSNPGFAPAQSDVGGLTAQRQSQAVDNIAVVLEALGERGRESCLTLAPLLVVTNWQDHLRASGNPPTTSQILLDEKLAMWWNESRRDWGAEPPRTEPTAIVSSSYSLTSGHNPHHASSSGGFANGRRASNGSASSGYTRQLMHPQPHPLAQPLLLLDTGVVPAQHDRVRKRPRDEPRVQEEDQDRKNREPHVPKQQSGTRSRSQSLIHPYPHSSHHGHGHGHTHSHTHRRSHHQSISHASISSLPRQVSRSPIFHPPYPHPTSNGQNYPLSRPSPDMTPTPAKVSHLVDHTSGSISTDASRSSSLGLGLGLYTKGETSTSPRELPLPESAVSATSSMTLPTPGTSASRFGPLPSLPYPGYRPRAHSTLERGFDFEFSPKFELNVKSTPRIGSGDSGSALDMGIGGNATMASNSAKREWDDIIGTIREKDRDEQWRRQSTSGLEGAGNLSHVKVEGSSSAMEEDNREKERYHPYSRPDRQERDREEKRRRESWWDGRRAAGSSGYTPAMGIGLGIDRHQAQAMESGGKVDNSRQEKDRRREEEHGPVGIAALVSAAEERARERTEAVA